MRVRFPALAVPPVRALGSARRRSVPASAALVVLLALGGAAGLSACGDDETTVEDIDPAAAGAPTPGSPVRVGPADAEVLLSAPPAGLIVLDVRTPEEFADGHLEGARLVDFQSPTFAADVSTIDRDAPIFVYCRSDNRSGQAVAAMVEMGFTNLTELEGGIVAWEAAGLPVVTG